MRSINRCKLLWAAVIETAARDLNKKAYREKALMWLNSTNDSEQSFIWCCDVLNLDPDKTKAGVLKGCACTLREV